ncbi:hypothetical protein BGX26_003569 [Mortierella sp. AD094]|nr:hypothetical protein BGX26_003569 [Mortierella sp. AD094]
MTKQVTLDGFNKLPGLQLLNYIINSVDGAGLHMVISAAISNPSTIGMVIPVSQFNTAFHGKTLGPAVAQGLTLVPHGNSTFVLNATIASGNGDLTPYLSGIFRNALNGVATPLEAQGTGAPGVSWLDAAIKSLVLETSLPPLTEAPITSVAIDKMSMDFSCDGCVWAPNAVSTITAVTNLPFANGAPIAQLRQNIEVLDKHGAVVGTLNTTYAVAKATGNSVTSTSPSAQLTIADGSHAIYESFITDLTAATTYEIGLCGTADSVLDLGTLGQVEVKGIKLDVKTSLKGLQGLSNATYVSLLSMTYALDANFSMIFFVSTLVNMHNPSDLTLTLGNLALNMGTDATPSGYAGVATISNMTLAPGDNQVISYATIPTSSPMGQAVVLGSNSGPVPVVLYAFSGSSNNTALNAGLTGLQTHMVIPMGLPRLFSSPIYSRDWTVKFLPTTVQDGLVEMTTTFNNPYFGTAMYFSNAQPTDTTVITNVNSISIETIPGSTLPLFNFLNNIHFDLQPNASKTITFQMQINRAAFSAEMINYVSSWVNASSTGVLTTTSVEHFSPELRTGVDPHMLYPEFKSVDLYPPNGFLNLHTGPDFALFLDWFNKNVMPPSTPSPSPSPSTSAATLPPSTTATATSTDTPTTPSPNTTTATAPSSTGEPSPVPPPATTTTTTTTTTTDSSAVSTTASPATPSNTA